VKKILVAGTALYLILSGGLAFAADLPSRKGPPPVYVPPPPQWTGFYVGLNAGGTWSASNSVGVSSLPGPCVPNDNGCNGFFTPGSSVAMASAGSFVAPSSGSGGFIGGGQIGYNFQFANSFVAGIEADIQGVTNSGGRSSVLTSALSDTTFGFPVSNLATLGRSIDYIGTLRGRLGFLVTPTLLAYATGGLAYGGVRSSAGLLQAFTTDPSEFAPASGGGSFSDTRVGWTVGGGLEWMFMPNWSLKGEYLYYDLGNVTYSVSPLAIVNIDATPNTVTGSTFPQVQTRFNGHIARAGVNYHFNWGAPTIASY
jgi:outer membrane immunogenic protein